MTTPKKNFWMRLIGGFAATYGVIWTAIESGQAFQVPFIKVLPNAGFRGYLLIFGVAAVFVALGLALYKLWTDSVARAARQIADSRRKISKDVTLIQSQTEISATQIQLVRTARSILTSTGSRSHNKEYLAAIEKRLGEVSTLEYTRILFGPIRRDELRTHCADLVKSAVLANRARVVQVVDIDRLAESFFISNDTETLLIIPSLNSIGRFDCGLLLRGQYHKMARNVLDSYAKAAIPWNPSLP